MRQARARPVRRRSLTGAVACEPSMGRQSQRPGAREVMGAEPKSSAARPAAGHAADYTFGPVGRRRLRRAASLESASDAHGPSGADGPRPTPRRRDP